MEPLVAPPPIDTKPLIQAIDRGVCWLAERQLDHGEIPLRVGRPGDDDTEADSTVFATAQALHSLSFVDHPGVQPIFDRALRFLEDEKVGRGLWRFWTRRNPKHRGIPPDLDDTCCVSEVLVRYGASAPSNLAILLGNRDSKGRFFTWILPRLSRRTSLRHAVAAIRQWPFLASRHPFWQKTEAEFDDVDAIVNANVLLYLGERPETRGAVRHLVELYGGGLESNDPGNDSVGDKWYLDPCALAYMLSRPYFHGVDSLEPLWRPILDDLTGRRQADGGYGSALDTALAVCAQLNFHQSVSDDVEVLIASQQDGRWPAAPLYYGGPKRSRCWGSEELTTAICLEALARTAGDNA